MIYGVHCICEVTMSHSFFKDISPGSSGSNTLCEDVVPARHIVLTHDMEEIELSQTPVRVRRISADGKGRFAVHGSFDAQPYSEIFAWIRCKGELIASEEETVSTSRGCFTFTFHPPEGVRVTPGRLIFMVLDHE